MQAKRAESIRDAMRHAWRGYKKVAWGMDVLMPVSGQGRDDGFSHAVTMVDALDTLWIMGLREEFDEAKRWLQENLPGRIRSTSYDTIMFETSIRTFGGLLSAYALSKDHVFKDLSLQLGGLIASRVWPDGQSPYKFGEGPDARSSLAVSGSCQLEMRYLSHISGNQSFAQATDKFYETVRGQPSIDGLWPSEIFEGSGELSMGGNSDSFYEYLLKVWLQGGKKEEELWSMYDAAADGMEKHLVREGDASLLYLGKGYWDGSNKVELRAEMEHLMCFVPGWLALGAMSRHDDPKREHRSQLAASLAETCYQMYAQQPTHIGPEKVRDSVCLSDSLSYIQRPEAMEAWFYMHELTGDAKYREWGWRTFQAYERHLKVENGYAGLIDVADPSAGRIDKMESFFLAETLKYAYLLQSSDHEIKLDQWVFNTEAHLLPILQGV